MLHNVFAPGLHNRAYFHRYTDDNVDLCDVLSSFSFGAKVKLDELSRMMGRCRANLIESMGRSAF
jgi:Predicted 3'-5' exonuclease related to the exonuclease domain of PolB